MESFKYILNFIFNFLSGKNAFYGGKFPFLLITILFIITRLLTLMSFPIFNDEAVHLQFSQMINLDYWTYKFISSNNVFGDWKPPLMYWLGSISIHVFENPLFSGRFLSFLFSFLGILGIYYLTKDLYDKKTAFWAVLLFVLCPPILMYNTQFVAETYVFSTATIFYLFCVRALKPSRYSVIYISLAVLTGAALLLFKQSGTLYLYLGVFFIFALPTSQQQLQTINKSDHSFSGKQYLMDLAKKFLFIIIILVLSIFIYKAVIPSQIEANKAQFTSMWTLSIKEILKFPLDTWLSNFRMVESYYSHYYTIAILPTVLGFLIYTLMTKDRRDVVLLILFIVSSSAIIFGLKRFNEYIYNTATIIFLIIIAGRFLALLIENPFAPSKNYLVIRSLFLFVFILMVSHWVYQISLMKLSPAKYIERSSQWMRDNYLEGWPSGFGIDRVIDFLKKQPPKSIAFVDPQWGNPGTSLQVFADSFPQIKIVLINRSIFDPNLKNRLDREGFSRRFVIYKPWGEKHRQGWEYYVEANLCINRTEYKVSEKQIPIVVCSF